MHILFQYPMTIKQTKKKETNFMKKDRAMEWFTGSEE